MDIPERQKLLSNMWNSTLTHSLIKEIPNGPVQVIVKAFGMEDVAIWDKDFCEIVETAFIKLAYINIPHSRACDIIRLICKNCEILSIQRKDGSRSKDSSSLNGMLVIKFVKNGYVFETSIEHILICIVMNNDIILHSISHIAQYLHNIEKLIPLHIIGPLNRVLNKARMIEQVEPMPDDINTNPKYLTFCFEHGYSIQCSWVPPYMLEDKIPKKIKPQDIFIEYDCDTIADLFANHG